MTISEPEEGLTTRIAVIAPSDGINDDEYNNYLPPDGGVTLLWTRYDTPAHDEPISVSMVGSYGDLGAISQSARMMRITRPHVAVYCCNSCGFVQGPSGDRRIREAIGEATGAAVTSVTHAQIEALRTLGVSRVAVAAPYPAGVTVRLVEFLEESGFRVTGSCSKEFVSEWQIGNAAPSVWLDLARQADSPEAEAVVLACSGIRTSAIMEEFENTHAKPLVAAPAVVMWHALRLAGFTAKVRRAGRLFEAF